MTVIDWSTTEAARAPRRRRARIGGAWVDDVSSSEAIDFIADLVAARRGGIVVTPNVDHVVLLEDDARLRAAYASASLSLADGMPIVWASRLLGTPVREKVSGSDLILPLARRAAQERWRVYLLGGSDGSAARAAEQLAREAPGLVIAGIDTRRVDVDGHPRAMDELAAAVGAARADLVLLALGCPKQEIVMHRIAAAVRPAVCVGIGAGLDFVAGAVPRAPRWMSGAGLEWLYRLAREPRRLWRRYLLRDPRFFLILLRDLFGPRARGDDCSGGFVPEDRRGEPER
jgi:N-acetylglucosaminyldiphosphoundecaprenol N-acetyl-beta-D-mannosaminyltransferase